MSYESEFDQLFPDTVTWRAFAGMDSHGARTLAAQKQIKGRVEEDAAVTRDPSTGRESVTKRTVLYLKPTAIDGSAVNLDLGGSFYLASGYVLSDNLPAGRVMRVNDESGLHHYEVYL